MSDYFGAHEGHHEDCSRQVRVERASRKTVCLLAEDEENRAQKLEKHDDCQAKR